MISVKGHIRVLRAGKAPLDLTEYVEGRGFEEMTYASWEDFVAEMKRREDDALSYEGEVKVSA